MTILNNTITLSFLIGLSVFSFKAHSALPKGQELNCKIQFEFDSYQFNDKEFFNCIKKLPANDLRFIHIFATASYPGTMKYNRKLSRKRAQAIKDVAKKALPGVRIVALGGGEHPAGQQAKVFVYAYSEKVMQEVSSQMAALKKSYRDVNNKLKEEANRKEFFIFRYGRDKYREGDNFYNTFSIDYKRRFEVWKNGFYPTLGGNLSSHSEDNFLDLYSAHATAGIDYRYKALVIGLEANAGLLRFSGDRDDTSFDGGGKLKLGLEGKKWISTVDGGIGTQFNQLGLSIGVKF